MSEETITVSQWANELDMSFSALRMRILRGWNIERAFNQPIGGR